jgi:hypothetical protein
LAKYFTDKKTIPMKSCITLLASYFFSFCCLAQMPTATNSLTDELLDVTVHRLKTSGPDFEIAQFISMERDSAWLRRDTFFTLSRGYLDDTNAAKVSGALDIFYRLRGYQPMEWIGGPTFEEVNTNFFAKLDEVVLGHFSYFKSLHNDDVYERLSLYLGCSRSAEAHRQLREIANSTKNNEQTLICLAWQRNPADMDFLLPFMLADSPAASNLPYHFRNSYGQAAIPYLCRTISDAKSAATRLEAAFELVHLRVPAGFQYLQNVALKNPSPEGKHATQLERIRQFATDYLGLPKDVVKKEVIAAFIAKKQTELP